MMELVPVHCTARSIQYGYTRALNTPSRSLTAFLFQSLIKNAWRREIRKVPSRYRSGSAWLERHRMEAHNRSSRFPANVNGVRFMRLNISDIKRNASLLSEAPRQNSELTMNPWR